MSKQRLMLSAAVAVLCASAAVTAALADTDVTTGTTTALSTTTAGNITVESSGAISVKNGGAVISLDSNNTVTNNGVLTNGDNDGGIGVLIDTTNQNIVGNFTSTNTISVAGGGVGKNGVFVLGGNTLFGNITINNITPLALVGSGSALTVGGDSVAGFRQDRPNTIDGDVTFGGPLTANAAAKPAAGTDPPILAIFKGTVNGNIVFDNTVVGTSIGQGAEGVIVTGALHSCASDAARQPSGFTCPTGTGGLGALVNQGKIITAGQVFVDPLSKDPILEGGPALSIGGSIDGGVFNGGPFVGNAAAVVGTLAGNGTDGNAIVYIDPAIADVPASIFIRPVGNVLDPIDPGYSFDNRGSISATPSAQQTSAVTMFIQGATPTLFTCLGNGTSLADCGSDGKGGILNTGSIASNVTTNATGVVTTNVTSQALVIGPYAVIPRLDLKSENTGLGVFTSGTINASVSGTSGGIATAVTIAQLGSLPAINVGQGASIIASVTTTNVNPTSQVAVSNSPFTLVATAITDSSNTLKTINNAGTIQASITTVTPASDAVVTTAVRALDLTSSTINGIQVNNTGKILGDIFLGSGGNNYVFNVGNTGAGASDYSVVNSPNNYAVVAYSIGGSTAGAPPSTLFNTLNFGAGLGHTLHVGAFGFVNSAVISSVGALDVTVDPNGFLFLANTSATGSLNANHFDINGGTLGLTILQSTTGTTPVVRATTEATIQANSVVALQFGSFISSGTTNNIADYTTPKTQHLVLISAPTVTDSGLATQNANLSENLPFLFQPTTTPLSIGTSAGNQTLELALTPRVPGKGDGLANDTPGNIAGLGLTGDALAQFPYVASALATDPSLGAAIASSLTVYNTPGVASSKVNIAASQQKAQQAFSQFGPDTSGGARAVAILITDQESGPVAARQRLLRSYGNVAGDLTLWGVEFAGNINNKGRVDADGTLTNYKDHGFGFTLGLDSGSPRGGWYGGAFTFYGGDVIQTLPRNTKTHTQWYMLTGYTSWKGKHLFLDTQISAAYGNFKGLRDLDIGSTSREAVGNRAGAMVALGANTGAIFKAGALEIVPHFSLDGLSLREEGYNEVSGGTGFNLQVAPYYANSLRPGVGIDFKAGMNIFGLTVTPEARLGYRYELINSPVKLKAGFIGTGGTGTVGNSMTFVGPDPDTGTAVGGLSFSTGTDTWNLGVHYDYLRGNNASTAQVGTITLLGRI